MSLPDSSSIGASVEAGWGSRGGERSEPERAPQLASTEAGAPIPDPQVIPKAEKAKRRKFSASEKRRILEAVDQATEPGGIGRVLRREGIYHAQLSKWRRQRADALTTGLADKPRGVKGPEVKTLQQENAKLQRENLRLQQQLKRAETIIEFQKKAAALFETTTVTEES